MSKGTEDGTGNQGMKTTKVNWPVICKELCAEYDTGPDIYNPNVMRDFRKLYEDHIIWMPVKSKYQATLEFMPIEFESEDLREEYHKAEEAHYKRKAKIEANSEYSESQRAINILASYTIFTKAAENCRRYFLGKWANDTWNSGFAPAIGFRFKQTGSSVIRILMEDYNWSRRDISIIWGGATETLSAKNKLAKRIQKMGDKALDMLDELGIDTEKDLDIDLDNLSIKTEEQYEWEKRNKLLTQKPEEREEERNRYNRQDSKLALFSYKSGGVGLSLHHQKMYPKARPRRGMFTPDYSEKLGVQALGRLPRLTSISDTRMWFCWYKGTIEKEVIEKFKMKCKSMQELTRHPECWNEVDEDIGAVQNLIIV